MILTWSKYGLIYVVYFFHVRLLPFCKQNYSIPARIREFYQLRHNFVIFVFLVDFLQPFYITMKHQLNTIKESFFKGVVLRNLTKRRMIYVCKKCLLVMLQQVSLVQFHALRKYFNFWRFLKKKNLLIITFSCL